MKLLKRALAAAVALLLAVSLSACGGHGADSLLGQWVFEYSPGGYIASGIDAELLEYVDSQALEALSLEAHVEFSEDGKYAITIPPEQAQSFIGSAGELMKDGYRAYLEEQLNEAFDGTDITMSVDDLLEQSGSSIDSIIDELMQPRYEEMLQSVEGRWTAEDGAVYLSSSPDAEPDMSNPRDFELDGDTLTLSGLYGAEDLVLTKQK